MDVTREETGRGRGSDRVAPGEGVTFCATVTVESVEREFGEGSRSGGRVEERVELRGDVKDVDFAGLREGCDVVRLGRSGRSSREGVGEDTGTDAVDATLMRDGLEGEDGVVFGFVVRVVVVREVCEDGQASARGSATAQSALLNITKLTIVLLASLAETFPSHHGDFVGGAIHRLSSRHEGARHGVPTPLLAEVVPKDVETQAGPCRDERVEQRVGRQVGLKELSVFEHSGGQERDWRRCALLLFNLFGFVHVHPFFTLVVVVVVFCCVDDLSRVFVLLELILPLVFKLSHALFLGRGTIRDGGSGGSFLSRGAGRGRRAFSHGGRVCLWRSGRESGGRKLELLAKRELVCLTVTYEVV